MNIKKLRTNYKNLSLKERLILLDSAESREDVSEIQAIASASKEVDWVFCDFAQLREKIKLIRLVNLAQRLKHQAKALFYLSISEKLKAAKNNFFYESARFEAYSYCVSVKVQEAVFAEIGLDHQKWLEREKEIFELDILNDSIDVHLNDIAFTETEAADFIKRTAKKHDLGEIEFGNTFENEITKQRQFLKDCGLAEMFKV